MDRMPAPGDVCPGFISEAGRCWRMVYDHNLQATPCAQKPAHTERWFSPRGDQWWIVWAYPAHLDGLTAIQQFGG